MTQHASSPTADTLYPLTLLASAGLKYLAYGALLSLLGFFGASFANLTDLSLPEFYWTRIVYLVPTSLLAILDSDFAELRAKEIDQQSSTLHSKSHAAKSAALLRIAGFGDAGDTHVGSPKLALSTLGSIFSGTHGLSLPGLGNRDNSCYQNSVLQSLASLTSLQPYLDRLIVEDDGQTTGYALKELASTLNDKDNSGRTIWTPEKLKNMNSSEQQDAQEYFSKMVDEMEKDGAQVARQYLRRRSQEAFSPNIDVLGDLARLRELPEELQSVLAQNPFNGLQAQRVGCLRCGYAEGLTFVPFNCLTLTPRRVYATDVATCLDDYTALEPIPGVECTKCSLLQAKQSLEDRFGSLGAQLPALDAQAAVQDAAIRHTVRERLQRINAALDNEDFSEDVLKRCFVSAQNKVSTKKTRQAVVARCPKVLVLHFNRSVFDEETGTQSKNCAGVEFPLTFDLKPWCLGSQADGFRASAGVEQWTLDPSKSLFESDNTLEGAPSEPQYELRAVITHSGQHENGHYICYRQSSSGGPNTQWWRLSDSKVSEVSETTLLAQGGVFMLFYELRDSVNAVVPPEHLLQSRDVTDRTIQGVELDLLSGKDEKALSFPPERDYVKYNTPSSSSEPIDTPLSTPPSTPPTNGLPNLSPRSGHDSMNSPGSAMDNVAGFVQAN